MVYKTMVYRRYHMREMMKSARRIFLNVSTAVQQWRGSGQWPNKNRDLSTAVKQWSGVLQWPSRKFRYFENRFIRHEVDEVGYTVDVADLLFSPERDFLIKNNGQRIKVDDLRGKTIVLFMVPLDVVYWSRRNMESTRPGAEETWDMIDAYCELLRVGSDVEFVFVPVLLRGGSLHERFLSQEAFFHQLFSTMPFPAIPFSDAQARESPLVQTFSVDDLFLHQHLPHWVLIDPTNTVVATRTFRSGFFKLFGGAELHPLSLERIRELQASHRKESISNWDELLASDTRDFLLSSNGDKVPISSLKGKLVGLYFCENIRHPPRMRAIKKVYEEAKSRGYDFEIVQITFHYYPFNAKYIVTDPTVRQRCEGVSWLTLPFKDPSCRKLQRILRCEEEKDDDDEDDEEEDEHWVGDCLVDNHWVGDCLVDKHWVGDSLVLIYPHQGEAEAEADDSSGVLFEFSGAKILERWGIEGYPFTRPSLYKAEYERQKREVTLQSLFPREERLLQSVGDGFDLVDAVSQLSGKRVLVLFAPHSGESWPLFDLSGHFISKLKSEYEAQLEGDVAEESKFEVVYVSTHYSESSFKEFIKDMPWLVRPFSSKLGWGLVCKVFKANVINPCAAAFNEQGELIAKAENLLHEKKQGDKLQFPFIDQDLEKCIGVEVDAMCDVANYRSSD